MTTQIYEIIPPHRCIIDNRITELCSSATATFRQDHICIHFPNDAQQLDIDNITAAIMEYNALIITASKGEILADGIDSVVITCAALPTNFNYVVYRCAPSHLDYIYEQAGNAPDGILEFSAIEAAKYLIEIRNPANYESGYIEIEAVEAES